MIKAFFIDLDGVLRIWPRSHDREAEEATGLPIGAIRQAAFARALLEEAVTGQISDEAWRRHIVTSLQQKFPDADSERAVRLWSASAGEVDGDVLELVQRCRHNVPVTLISNATSRLPSDLQRLGLSDAFDHIINSSVVGWCKPQPGIFDAALGTVGVLPEEALFVDDTMENVAAANELGLVGHTFTGVAQLKQSLQGHRLL